MEDENLVFFTHRDGEQETAWDPVVSYVQGSLAEERARGTTRIPKDRKEFSLVRKLNRQYRVPFIQLLEDTAASVV